VLSTFTIAFPAGLIYVSFEFVAFVLSKKLVSPAAYEPQWRAERRRKESRTVRDVVIVSIV
jgi:hypothetical protein